MATQKSVFRKIALSEYRSHFLQIFSSKVLIALVGFVVTPIVARLYQPSDYGLFALMTTLTLTLSFFTNLSLPVAILVTSKEKLTNLVRATFGYSIISNFCFFLLSSMFMIPFSTQLFGTEFSAAIIICSMIALGSFLITFSQIFANLNIREKAFKTNIVVNILDNFSIRATSLTLGFLRFTKFGLFSSDLIGKVVNVITQISLDRDKLLFLNIRRSFSLQNIRRTIWENSQYPLFNVPLLVLSNFSTQLVLWLLAIFFSTSAVGHFTMSMSLLGMPLQLLSNSTQPLVTKKLADELRDNVRSSAVGLLFKLLLLSTGVYAFIYLVVPPFIELYLGKQWISTIAIARILCVPYGLQLVGSSMSGAFVVFEKQKVSLIIKAVSLSILIAVIYFQIRRGPDLTEVVVLYSIVVSLEEFTKIIYISLFFRDVRGS